jgi:hypothetical protein
MHFASTDKKWKMECLVDDAGHPRAGGLVARNVTHEEHNFATDIRVIGFWIGFEKVESSGQVVGKEEKFYVLDDKKFSVSEVKELVPKPVFHPAYGKTFAYLREADAALNFTDYFKEPTGNYVGWGLKVEYRAPEFFATHENCEYSGLNITQTFLFSPYGTVPAHEPSGKLPAARCHPMLTYALVPNKKHIRTIRYTRLSYIRFDYRLHLLVDGQLSETSASAAHAVGNQAGLFRDTDSGLMAFGIPGVADVFTFGQAHQAGISRGIFASGEKPVVREVIAPALLNGVSGQTTRNDKGDPETRICWDNIHWWGSRGKNSQGKDNDLPSTPGAFHAAHLHWRWSELLHEDGPQFVGRAKVDGMETALVDPAIWMQTQWLAITKYDPKLDPMAKGVTLESLSKAKWATLFNPGLRATPAEIADGAEIVLWFSFYVPREASIRQEFGTTDPHRAGNGGTIFLQGIFFAHNDEPGGGLKVGSTSPIHRPRSKKDIKNWDRDAGSE